MSRGRSVDPADSKRGILNRAWIFITADHGEEFGEHDQNGHGGKPYNGQTRIPLIVLPPQGEKLAIPRQPVSLVDITATVSAIAGVQPPLGIGNDLRETLPTDRPVYIEYFPKSMKFAKMDTPESHTATRAVVIGNAKLIAYPDHKEFYRLDEDPQELVDRVDEITDQVHKLTKQLPPLRFSMISAT